ncbi:MAG: glycosyltransferase family 2 protein [Proteobacteria bacterium]|nr:glycosyltransferase family 2 protein [Pseudomonadota bacterium]
MVTFIVPAFNEQDNVAPTVATIRAAAVDAKLDTFEIVIVNDGSTDSTGATIDGLAAADRTIRPVHNPENFGLGASIRAGIAAATAPSFMVVPGDNDVSKSTILMMLIFRNEADIILMSPLNKEQRNLFRNILSTIYQAAYMIFFGIYVVYINAPGIWPTERAREAALRARRFSIISELNVKLLRMGCTFAEIPGYLQGGPKARGTVTLRALTEVVGSFIRLLVAVYITDRQRFGSLPKRKQIDFVSRLS